VRLASSVFSSVLFFAIAISTELAAANYRIGTEAVEVFATALEKLDTARSGTQIKYQGIIESDSSPSRNREQRPTFMTFWTGKDGVNVRSQSTEGYAITSGKIRLQEGWFYRTSDFVFAIQSSWLEGEEDQKTQTYNGMTNSRLMHTPYSLFGVRDFSSGITWYEMLRDSESDVEIDEVSVSGHTKVLVNTSGYGKFEFEFDTQSETPRLVSVFCRKSPTDFYESDRYYDSFEYLIEDIQYREFEGKQLISGMTYTLKTEPKGSNSTSERSYAFTMLDVQPFSERLKNRISFPDIDIEDGTSVRIHDDAGVPYEYRSGMIVRVVDGDAIITEGEARFRKPKSTSAFWIIGLVTLLVVFGLILIKRRS